MSAAPHKSCCTGEYICSSFASRWSKLLRSFHQAITIPTTSISQNIVPRLNCSRSQERGRGGSDAVDIGGYPKGEAPLCLALRSCIKRRTYFSPGGAETIRGKDSPPHFLRGRTPTGYNGPTKCSLRSL